jgi:hypothetical protein
METCLLCHCLATAVSSGTVNASTKKHQSVRARNCCRYHETDLELTKKKTPPLHSNSPPSPSNMHTTTQTKKQRNPASPFRLYIYVYI